MIGGNMELTLQKSTATKNGIGESVRTWTTVTTLTGFLDLSSGDSRYATYDAKIQESTHVFVADYKALNVQATNCRAVDSNGLIYDVTLIDDPMNLHKHLEVFLKYVG